MVLATAAGVVPALGQAPTVESLYRVARLHARLGHRDAACEYLERVSQAGLVPVRVHEFLTEQFFVEYRLREEVRR